MSNQDENKYSIINYEAIRKLQEENYQRQIKLLNRQINYFDQQIIDNREKIDLFVETITKLTSNITKLTSENTKLALEIKNMKYQNQIHNASGDNVGRDKNITNNYYNQDIYQLAQDIQALLEKLDKKNDSNTTSEKMMIATEAIQHIEKDTNFKNRIIKSLSSGSIDALASLLNHPAASFVIGAIKTWQQTKK